MSLPGFDKIDGLTARQLQTRIVNRVRFERRQLELTQKAFAQMCGIPLRTYKRFELDQCDSLEVFIKLVMAFERVTGIEVLFPARLQKVRIRTPIAALKRMQERNL
ncbi:Conserved hypothetical protein, putative transcriptional regulator [Herminiimonas arsenicoxydans]|jgi:transcriptional regulator with XRE-family HTH domain|uniref:HTH cro/C1-type domain-containing protein n=1 Tax=Herminiimonas arsenicoxydans TaxID=204773 RepID=A4G9X4_HERAR|nr:Conserved hypothetical protein, putative transcriptional regulator [Herminiimonas arsenicoxydans]